MSVTRGLGETFVDAVAPSLLLLALVVVIAVFFPEGTWVRHVFDAAQLVIATASIVIAVLALRDGQATSRTLEETQQHARASAEALAAATATLDHLAATARLVVHGRVASEVSRSAGVLGQLAGNIIQAHGTGISNQPTWLQIAEVMFQSAVVAAADLEHATKTLGPAVASAGAQVRSGLESAHTRIRDYREHPVAGQWGDAERQIATDLIIAFDALAAIRAEAGLEDSGAAGVAGSRAALKAIATGSAR